MTGDKYKVITTYCNNQQTDHEWPTLEEATADFAGRLAEIAEPTGGEPIKSIEFSVLDNEGEQRQFTLAGPFECPEDAA